MLIFRLRLWLPSRPLTSILSPKRARKPEAQGIRYFFQTFKIQCPIIRHPKPSAPAPRITGMIPHFHFTMPMKATTHTTMAK